jgi:outer membrane immunogenic protein
LHWDTAKGSKVKKILLTTTALIALGVAPAAAADLAARPYTKAPAAIAMYDWSGFYAGVNGGWGSSRQRWDETSLGVALPMGSHDATGGTVGGQIGYRWQAASWVFGVEAQGNWADFHGSNVVPFVVPSVTNDTRVDAFGLFTGQVGYAANNVLFYLKGGAAVTSDRYRLLATGTNAQVANSVDETRWGGVIGVGLEYGFAPNWSAGIEYNHLFMQDRTHTFVDGAGAFFAADRIRQDVDLVTVRVNYRWGGAAVARY